MLAFILAIGMSGCDNKKSIPDAGTDETSALTEQTKEQPESAKQSQNETIEPEPSEDDETSDSEETAPESSENDEASESVQPQDKDKVKVTSKTIDGTRFSLTLSTEYSLGGTTDEQVKICEDLFWYCYPKMYERFATKDTPTDVKLNIQVDEYEVAYTMDDTVVINDNWLSEFPDDYDCLTHEFAHVIQAGWDDNYVPTKGDDTYMIERFADYCRFVYAYKDGFYNDSTWELQTKDSESSYDASVRFWVWLDYTYSTEDIDIIKRISDAIGSKKEWASSADWEDGGAAWDMVFDGTMCQGKSLTKLWNEYEQSDFAVLSSKADSYGEGSELNTGYNVRKTLKDRLAKQ